MLFCSSCGDLRDRLYVLELLGVVSEGGDRASSLQGQAPRRFTGVLKSIGATGLEHTRSA